jgi:tetratricopeptide (TPR) repeat protein
MNSSNVEACRLLARIAEQQGQAAAIGWRQQAVTIAPTSIEDGLALAKTALQFDKIAIAESALAKLGPEAARLATYYELKARVADAKKDPAGAEKNFAEAVRLDPSNKFCQLNLAVYQLQSSSPEIRLGATKLLQQFLEDKAFRVPAARALRDDAVQKKDVSTLLRVSELLYGYPEATFRDRATHVQVLHALDRPDFAQHLTDLQNEALSDPGTMTYLLSWMITNHLTILALQWIKELPPEVVNKQPVPVAVADCYIAINDWDGLQQWCKKTNWADFEFLRHAYLSRALRELGDNLGSASEWEAVLQQVGSKGEQLHGLQQVVVKWGWTKEAEDLLWRLSKDLPQQDSALAALYQYYVENGDTGGLYRVVARLCEMKPDDEKAQNNFTQLSLLLNLNLKRAYEMAEQLHQKDPKNAIFASTYAFSLYRKGRFQEAAKIMSELKPEELQSPDIAAYYGIFLAAAGDNSKAAEYLEKGSAAPLLPEEKLLLQNARNKISGHQP